MSIGNAYADNPKYANLNLRYLSEQIAVSPTPKDIQIFSKFLELLRRTPLDETPGKCEKRLKEAKFLPAPQHIIEILQSLALVGIWPSQFISLSNNSWVNFGEITIYEKRLKNTQGRSDMLMPWAGW